MSAKGAAMQLYRVTLWYVATRWASRKANSVKAFARRATRRGGGRVDLMILACDADEARSKATAWFHAAIEQVDAHIMFGAGGRDALFGTIDLDPDRELFVSGNLGDVAVL